MHAEKKYTSVLAQAAAKYTSIQLTGILLYNALGQAAAKYTSMQLRSILVCTSALGQAAGGRGRS